MKGEKGDITIDTTEIQRTIRDYKQIYANKFDNLEEIDKCLDTYILSIVNHEEIENLNRPITSNKIGSVIKSFPKKKPRVRWYH
jgi:hypothetical protein